MSAILVCFVLQDMALWGHMELDMHRIVLLLTTRSERQELYDVGFIYKFQPVYRYEPPCFAFVVKEKDYRQVMTHVVDTSSMSGA